MKLFKLNWYADGYVRRIDILIIIMVIALLVLKVVLTN